MLAADLVFWPVIAFMIGCTSYFRPRIKGPRMAMQWGLDGKPIWTAPVAPGIWGLVALAILVRSAIWAAMTFAPEKVNGPDLGLLLCSLTFGASHFWILRAAARPR